MPDRMGAAIDHARQAGMTWQQIADALGITHSGAIQAHQRWNDDQYKEQER